MRFDFWKYHGLGNDFILVDSEECAFSWNASLAKQACDRHRGIGGDGVLVLQPSDVADFRMVIYNADGSQPEMCGNGLRCFVRYAYEQNKTQKRVFSVETDRGVLECSVLGEGSDLERIRVEMGAPILTCEGIGIEGGAQHCIDESLECDGETLAFSAVSMGNPHMILFDWNEEQRVRLAPQLEAHPRFPEKTNVEFVRIVQPNELDVIVYERGCGYTEACGTGACAVAVAAIVSKRIPLQKEVSVHLPGGTLGIEVDPELKNVWLIGPAVPVFSGSWTA